jgi:Insecticidal Crystal Toxin, P42/Vacuolar protein sorting-associated protein 62
MEHQFGDLIIAFTSSFQFRYNDKGTGSHKDGGFWQPIPPKGFYALGGVGVNNYSDINGNNWAICVKAADNPSKPDPIAFPVDYSLIWADHGSGGQLDGSCWRPIAREGYVSLGDVFVAGYNKPSLQDVVCVRKDYTTIGACGSEIWNDQGSGAHTDIDVFAINSPQSVSIESQFGYFTANTYMANDKYAPITGSCLMLPLVSESASVPQPKLNSFKVPEPEPIITDRRLCVPFTAIKDDDRSLQWKIENSPFYYIERKTQYQLALFDYNQQSSIQTIAKTITEGTTTEQTKSFNQKTGINVSVESGIEAIGLSVSASYSYEMGWETTSSFQQFQESAVTLTLAIPAKTAAAAWVLNYSLCFKRMTGDYLPPQLSFAVDIYSQGQYPDTGQAKIAKKTLDMSFA